MGRTSSHCKQTLVALLVYILVMTPTLVFANTAEKWVVEKVVYESVAKVVNVTAKRSVPTVANNPSYLARVPVTSIATGSTVASMIRMGVAGALIYGVVYGAGWIIENGIVKKPVEGGELNTEFYWKSNSTWSEGSPACKNPTKYPDGQQAINDFKSCAVQNKLTDPSCSMNNFEQYKCKAYNERGSVLDYFTIDRFKNQSYDPNQSTIPVSDTELGDKVNNSPQAPQIIPDVYNPNNPAGGSAPNSTSDALDNAPPVPATDPTGGTKPKPNVDTDGDGIPDIYDPEKPSVGEELTLPEFCEWAVTVCEWYVKYKEDSKKTDEHREKELTLWQKVEDWFKKWDDTPEKDNDTELDIPEPELPNINTDISFGGSCPQPISVPYNFAGASGTIEFSYEPLCQIASFIKPVVITVSAFSAALIIGGIRTEDS